MLSLLKVNTEMGLIYALLGMGVLITYKILNVSDLSVEGTFPFGAFIFAKFVSIGFNPILATIMSFLFGSLAGLLTSSLFIGLSIEPILAGILTMTILYSVNRNILGSPNASVSSYQSIFDLGSKIIILLVFVLIIKILIDLFLKTEVGYLLIATGDNEHIVTALGQSNNLFKIMGMMLANGLIGMSGALMAQYNGFVDITMGQSIIVIALASIIIGDTLFKGKRYISLTTRVLVGALIYQFIGGLALELGLNPTLLKAVNAILVIIFIAYNKFIPSLINSKGAENNSSNR